MGISDGNEVADGGPVTFSATGQIFDHENWTWAQVYGQSVGTSDTAPADATTNAVSELQGTYGTLDVNEQTGTWQYFLNPGLASVKALAAGQTAVDTFNIQATDSTGGHTTQTVNVTVTGIDDAPTVGIASPGPVSTDENHAVTINGISVNDVDAGTSQIEVTLAAGHGALSLANAAGLDKVVTNNDGSIELFGSQAAIDTALSHGVIYTPVTDYSGADTLTVTANDQVSAALGGPLTGTGTVTVNVAPVAEPPLLSGPLANVVTDSLTGSTIDSTKWNVVLPTINQTGDNDSSVTPTSGGVVLHDHGYLDTVVGFTPTAATPLHISLSFSFDSGGGYVAVTDGTDGTYDPTFGAPANGLSFMFAWNGGVDVVNNTNGTSETTDATFNANTLYDASITDNGTSQTFVVTNDATGEVVATGTTDFSGYAGGNLVSITNREDNDNPHTATADNVSISSAYEGNEGGSVTLAGITASVTDPHETLTLVISGMPDGTTFSEGALATSGTYAGDWVITDQSEIAALATTPLTLTTPTDYSGTFTLAIEAVATDTATLTTGTATSTSTTTQDFAVTIAPTDSTTPVFNSMTLTIAQGGTDVLTDADFSISDPDTTHFLYSVSNVTGGQFEVFNGTNWVSAPTGGFTTQQIEAGQVEFIQDGSTTAPSFSITAADGTNVSAAISADGQHFTAPNDMALTGTLSFGGSGEHQGAAVTFSDGHLYLSYNNGAESGGTSDTADIVAFDTGSGSQAPTFTYAWGEGDFFGIAANSALIYAVGESSPGYGLTTDHVGGAEAKSILVDFDVSGTAGSEPSPADSYTPNNFFSYTGFESFNADIVVQTDNGPIVFAVGTGQPNSYDAYFIAEYVGGNLVAEATDSSVGVTFSNELSAPTPGSSGANGVADLDGNIWALGYTAWPTDNGGATNSQAVVWEYDTGLNLIGRFKDTDPSLVGHDASFNGGAVIGDSLYAVGYASNGSGGQNFLIADYHSDGSIAWSESFGPAGTDVLTSAVGVDGLLYVVGSTTIGGVTEGVLMEIDPSNGHVLSTVDYEAGAYNTFTSVTTDGQQLYVAGESGSSASQDQAVLLTYSIGHALARWQFDHQWRLRNQRFHRMDRPARRQRAGEHHAVVGPVPTVSAADAPRNFMGTRKP